MAGHQGLDRATSKSHQGVAMEQSAYGIFSGRAAVSAGRCIRSAGRPGLAVDPGSIPFGTPVWLVSSGATANLQKLVLAQDTGNAIIGAVRADYFAGWGVAAGELAGRLRQPLRLWVLWPKQIWTSCPRCRRAVLE